MKSGKSTAGGMPTKLQPKGNVPTKKITYNSTSTTPKSTVVNVADKKVNSNAGVVIGGDLDFDMNGNPIDNENMWHQKHHYE